MKQKTLKTFKVLIICFIVLNLGCNKEENQKKLSEKDNLRLIDQNLFPKTSYNEDMEMITLTVLNAVKINSDFRKLIKNEANIQFDGDYDILLHSFTKKRINNAKNSKTVMDLLCENISEETLIRKSKSGKNIIEELQKKYPLLQISVPVNIEKWITDNYVPLITFLPENYDEKTHKEITAYDQYGKKYAISTIEKPTEPVIVIGMNERIMDPGSIGNDPNAKTPTPYNLQLSTHDSGIHLEWEIATEENVMNYRIYRKESGTNEYSIVGTMPVFDPSFNDCNLKSSTIYYYYVTAFGYNGESSPSEVKFIKSPPKPEPPLSFNAILQTNEEVELRWSNDPNQAIDETVIEKITWGIDNEYKIFATIINNNNNLIDNNIIKGKKVQYKIQHKTELGSSNALYDFIQVPYRNPLEPSAVIVDRIGFTDWDIEHWTSGRPEFRLTITNVDRSTNETYAIQEDLEYEFDGRTKSQRFSSQVFRWHPTYWYDILTFTLIEHDASFETSLFINAKLAKKEVPVSKHGKLEYGSGFNFEWKIKNQSERCGNSYYYYYDEANTTIKFPGYGAYIVLKDKM